MTHDSIGLGEDGPTHQPIETLTLCRSTPNLLTFRPGDANEVSGSYLVALNARKRPSVLALSRQPLPNLEGSSPESVTKGAYVLQDQPNAKVIITATGSEVSLAVEAAQVLNRQGISTRVVSMPCTELYDEQPKEYKDSVFTPGTPVVSVEALGVWGWERYAHASVGMTDGQGNNVFGASGPYKDLYEHFNITTESVVKKAQDTITYFEKLGCVPPLGVTI